MFIWNNKEFSDVTRKVFFNKCFLVLFSSFILLIGLSSCESPANVDADRKVTRKYDPTLTGERLRIDGHSNIYLGQYRPIEEDIYTFRIQNISGSGYDIRNVLIEYSETDIAVPSVNVTYPTVPRTLGTSGDNSEFAIKVTFSDIDRIRENSGEKDVTVTVIGEIDTIRFTFSYDLPSIVIRNTQVSDEIKMNSLIPINLTFYNFSDRNHGLYRPVVQPSETALSIFAPDKFPMEIPPQGSSNLQFIFNPGREGDFEYEVGLSYQISQPDMPTKVPLYFRVVK